MMMGYKGFHDQMIVGDGLRLLTPLSFLFYVDISAAFDGLRASGPERDMGNDVGIDPGGLV